MARVGRVIERRGRHCAGGVVQVQQQVEPGSICSQPPMLNAIYRQQHLLPRRRYRLPPARRHHLLIEAPRTLSAWVVDSTSERNYASARRVPCVFPIQAAGYGKCRTEY